MDEQQKVRTITALSLAALAEAATPYGIEAFDSVLVRLWKGIRYRSSIQKGCGRGVYTAGVELIVCVCVCV